MSGVEITVRDWFAGQALAALIGDKGFVAGYSDHAKEAYGYAEAMLAARGEQPSSGLTWRSEEKPDGLHVTLPVLLDQHDPAKFDTIIVNGREFVCLPEPRWVHRRLQNEWDYIVNNRTVARLFATDDGKWDAVKYPTAAAIDVGLTLDEAKLAVIAAVGGGAK